MTQFGLGEEGGILVVAVGDAIKGDAMLTRSHSHEMATGEARWMVEARWVCSSSSSSCSGRRSHRRKNNMSPRAGWRLII